MKQTFLKNEIKYCFSPPINPTFDFGSNSPMKKLILVIVLQYIDSSSWSLRKKVMVGKYVTFDAMNEEEFRNKIRSSVQVQHLTQEDLESNIEKLINKLEQIRKKRRKKSMEPDSPNISLKKNSNNEQMSQEKSDNEEQEEKRTDIENEEYVELSQESDILVDIYDGTEPACADTVYNIDRNYKFVVEADEQTNLKRLLEESSNKNIEWDKLIELPDDEIDNSQELQNDDEYYKKKLVIRSDIWNAANYKLFKWTTIQGDEYRCFTSSKTIPNVIEEVNTFVKEWGIYSKAFDEDNEDVLAEYDTQKKKHDIDNAKRPKRKYKWKAKNLNTDMFYAINWTSDFGMISV